MVESGYAENGKTTTKWQHVGWWECKNAERESHERKKFAFLIEIYMNRKWNFHTVSNTSSNSTNSQTLDEMDDDDVWNGNGAEIHKKKQFNV